MSQGFFVNEHMEGLGDYLVPPRPSLIHDQNWKASLLGQVVSDWRLCRGHVSTNNRNGEVHKSFLIMGTAKAEL